MDAGEADIEEIEAEEIEEIAEQLSCPAPDAEAREVAPEELEDADDLLEEAVEAAAGQPAPGEIDAAADGVRPAELDDLIEQAIEAQIETVRPARGDIPLSVAAPSSELAREISACLSGAQSTAPLSGVSAAEEWLGHALFGYAPFGIPLGDRAQAATVEFSPVPRGQGEPCRRAREDGAG